MFYYYLNREAQPDGYHEIHKEGCAFLPSPKNRIRLGAHPNDQSAFREAKKHFTRVDGCYYCCKSIHRH